MNRRAAQVIRTVRFVAWLTARRAQSSWRLLLASTLGVLLAVTLVSVVVIHSNTLARAALRNTLAVVGERTDLGLELVVRDRPAGRPEYDKLDGDMRDAVQARLGWLSQGIYRLGNTLPMSYIVGSGQLSPEEERPSRIPAYLFFQSGLEEHTRLVSGSWPGSTPQSPDEGVRTLEAMIGADAARDMEWVVGTQIALMPFGSASTERVILTVVGIIEAIDPQEQYWFGNAPRLALEDRGFMPPLLPIHLPEQEFFDDLGARYPMLLGTYSWFVSLDIETLTPDLSVVALDSIAGLGVDINRTFPRSGVLSSLTSVVKEYERDLTVARVPLFLFTSLVLGVVLYYLVLISWMLARTRGPEVAMLRSRGASRVQVGALLGVGEGLLVVVPSAIVGPFLGLTIARVLPIGGSGLEGLAAELSSTVLVVAGVTGLMCIVVILASNVSVAGQTIVQFLRERTRPLGGAALYRYAIDMLVLAMVGLVWWQIRGRGGFVTRDLSGGGVEVDLTLLLGPALGLLVVGLVLLRVLPYALRLLARLASPVSGVWLVHGLNRMARDPLPHGSLAVLLMLATALGIFGSTFGSTLTGAQGDQKRYAIGGEIVARVAGADQAQTSEVWKRDVAALDGVQSVSLVNRSRMSAGGSSAGRSGSTSLLLVEPAELAAATWFREDFSDRDLDDLLLPLRKPVHQQPGVALPEGTERIGVWARPERSYSLDTLWVRYRSATGRYESVRLGNLDFEEWTYLEARLPEREHMEPPFTLVAIYLRGSILSGGGRGSVALDDVTAVVKGERRVIEMFEGAGPWQTMQGLAVVQDTLKLTLGAAYTGNTGALFEWTLANGGRPRGLFAPPVPLPLAAVGGPSFRVGQVVVGSVGNNAVAMEVQTVARQFPILDPNRGPFLLVNLETYNLYQSSLPQSRLVGPTELWIALEEGADKAQILAALGDIVPLNSAVLDREASAQEAEGDPLAGGAWAGLAWLALGSLSGVAILGLVFYVGLAFQRTRLELGVLRALGFTRRQVGLMLGLEVVTVTGIGAVVGVGAAAWMGGWILGYLGITTGGRAVVPSLVLTVDGQLALLAYMGVALAAVLATVLALTLANRLRVAEVLRLEE